MKTIVALMMFLFLTGCFAYEPKYKVNDCIYEQLSGATILINHIRYGRYFYTVYMFGMAAEESREIKDFDEQDNITSCER
jgi:hypothetical protein